MMKIAIENIALTWFEIPKNIEFHTFDQKEFNNIADDASYVYLIAYDNAKNLLLFQRTNSTKKPKFLQHQIDVLSFIKQQGHSFPASKKTLFSQAIGRKTQTILDTTGGWLGDSLLMCSQNYAVTVLERHWLLQGFIAEACDKLKHSAWLQMNKAPLPELVRSDAIQFLTDEYNSEHQAVDCIYIDPMFPPKVKKSAAVRKSMHVLHTLIGQDNDAEQLFVAAWLSKVRRIVVKRPDYAKTLGNSTFFGENRIHPTETLSGKLVRYDVYIR